MVFNQAEYTVRCEWGMNGVNQLAPISDAIIIVDVLSFSTCVDIAVERGAVVYPFWGAEETLPAMADHHGALIAQRRSHAPGYSLSPASLQAIPAETRLILPSPNGSRLSLATGATPTYAGCLRNARAVATAASRHGAHIGIVPAGERWPDGMLRPAWEDWIGAGAIAACLTGRLSSEALAAVAAYAEAQPELLPRLRGCASGRELIEAGFAVDVDLAAAENTSTAAPVLWCGAYVAKWE